MSKQQTRKPKREKAPKAPAPKAAAITSIDSPELLKHVDAIHAIGKQTALNMSTIGLHLIECKRLVGHGGWTAWLKREFSWSQDTASRFMQLAEDPIEFRKLRNLNRPLSSIYLLTTPSTPEAVREDIIERAGKGEKVKHDEVVAAVKAAKPKAEPAKAKAKGKGNNKQLDLLDPKPDDASRRSPLAWLNDSGDLNVWYVLISDDEMYRITPDYTLGLDENDSVVSFSVDKVTLRPKRKERNLVPKNVTVTTIEQAKQLAQADFDRKSPLPVAEPDDDEWSDEIKNSPEGELLARKRAFIGRAVESARYGKWCSKLEGMDLTSDMKEAAVRAAKAWTKVLSWFGEPEGDDSGAKVRELQRLNGALESEVEDLKAEIAKLVGKPLASIADANERAERARANRIAGAKRAAAQREAWRQEQVAAAQDDLARHAGLHAPHT
jgi:hypothetical protein